MNKKIIFLITLALFYIANVKAMPSKDFYINDYANVINDEL